MATVNLGRIKFVWQGAYNGATAYVADDVVSYNGASYICILASTNNLPTNTTYWNVMSSAGTNGTNGTDINAIAGLQAGDILTYNGTSFVRLAKGTANQVLRVNSGATALEYGTLAAGGVTEADEWRITTTFTSGSGTFNANWERADTDNFTHLGTGMTEASGIFSFPSTGYYSIDFKTYGYGTGVVYNIIFMNMTLNNSTYDGVTLGVDSNTGSSGYVGAQLFHVVKITDIVNQKVNFTHNSNTTVTYENDTTQSNTTARFIKLAGL